ncbi:hypothetical protein Cni_G13846 [Canna indica]|uniref:Protein kinase domain-containing protein n=1 Tax=Canna indica TaxID=4628 RepID=A0AAQ3KDE0_9LILI|nr:hypothetical protein Cni_G13846 [Canna indica]
MEFKVEVEAIGRVRHNNLVRLLGYCAEGEHRMLVYEYVGSGNLAQWLHGDVGPSSPLTWDARMYIIIGTTKGLLYLHEGLEPKLLSMLALVNLVDWLKTSCSLNFLKSNKQSKFVKFVCEGTGCRDNHQTETSSPSTRATCSSKSTSFGRIFLHE